MNNMSLSPGRSNVWKETIGNCWLKPLEKDIYKGLESKLTLAENKIIQQQK